MNAPPQGGPPLLELCGLHCRRGGRPLFTGLQLALRAGDLVELSGPNGGGKSTLLRIAAGLFRDFEGAASHCTDILYLGHHPALKAALSPRRNLIYFCALYELDPGGVEASLGEWGLTELADTPCAQLSAGQRQRTALARLSLSRARLWLLDEPLAGLDAEAAGILQRRLAAHADRGGAALVSAHRPGTTPTARLQFRPLVFYAPPAQPASVPTAAAAAPSLLRCFCASLHRDLQLLFTGRIALFRPALFFLAAIMLFALSRGVQTAVPAPTALGALWVSALLAIVLAGDELCSGDLEDGSLDLLLTAPHPLWASALARILASWVGVVLPLSILAPAAALLLSLPVSPPLWFSLLLGGGALSALSVTGAALTVGARPGNLLLGQLFLPLALPVLIFGVATAEAALGGFAWLPSLSLLAALSLGALLLLPAATAEGWRIAAGQ